MKTHVIEILREIVALMELMGEIPCQIRIYAKAAQMLEKSPISLEEIINSGKLEKINGILEISKDIVPALLLELRSQVPEGLIKMLKIPGLGAKKIRALWQGLGIQTIEELEWACVQGEISNLPGFSRSTERNILCAIERLRKRPGLFLFDYALMQAQMLADQLIEHVAVERIEISGSLRRRNEVVEKADILIASKDASSVVRYFVAMKSVTRVFSQGDTKASVQIKGGLRADLWVVLAEQFAGAMLYFTGNDKHNANMRARAKKYNLELGEFGLLKGKKPILYSSENEIFQKLGLPYISPELREGREEIDDAEKGLLPAPLKFEDLKGIFHIHTTYSDGLTSLKNIAVIARSQGLEYIGITDHSQSLSIGNGMKPATVYKQFKEIDRLNEKLKPFHIFKGIESDILLDGNLDYPPELMAQFDFVIGSIHGDFRISQAQMTKRIIRAIENPFLTMLGHPTGRLLLRREPFAVDMHAVIDAAAEHEVIIEINTHPLRMDMDWRLGKYARKRGLLTSLNPDAHSIEGLSMVFYGVGIARKAWFEPQRVFNTFSLDEIKRYFAAKKRRTLS